MLKDECDVAQWAIRNVPIPITAKQVEEIFVEGILVLVISGIDIILDIINSLIQINRGELELGRRRICEICLGRVKLEVQLQLLNGIYRVILLERDVDETVVRRLGRNIIHTGRCSS